MYVDLINSNNYISINISLIQLLGLNGAVYISELFNIFKKAKNKNKFVQIQDKIGDSCYFKLDRKYIYERTTITIEEQLQVDTKLMNLDIMKKDKSNPDLICLDIRTIIMMIANIDTLDKEEKETMETLKKKLKGKTDVEQQQIKRASIVNKLINKVEYDDEKVRVVLCEWVKSLYQNGKKITTKELVQFQTDLKTYSKDDKDYAISLVKTAISNAYTVCSYSVEYLKKSKKIEQQSAERFPRVTTQKRATIDDIMGGQKF